MRSKYKKYIFLIIILFCNSAVSQTAEEFSTKTAFMVKMSYFINWPESSILNKDNSTFIICIEGSPKYFTSLEDWATTGKIKKRPVTLKYINGDISELSSCNILFITSNHNLSSYLDIAREEKILTISDNPGNAQRGVIINFFNVKNKLRFEINIDEAKSLGFKISPRLLKLATIITSGDIK